MLEFELESSMKPYIDAVEEATQDGTIKVDLFLTIAYLLLIYNSTMVLSQKVYNVPNLRTILT